MYRSPLYFIETDSLPEPGTRLAASSPRNPPVSVLPIYVAMVTFYMDASSGAIVLTSYAKADSTS